MEQNKIEKLINNLGIEVYREGKQREFLEVMEEVVASYKQLTIEQKLYFRQTLFGLLQCSNTYKRE